MLQQTISQRQQQLLSFDQRQSLEILTCSNQELDTFLTEEYLQNPLLDCCRDSQSDIIDSLDGHYETATSYRDHYIRYEDEDSNRSGDIRAKEPSSLKDQLKGQLSSMGYTEKEWELIDCLIGCLDDRGFFNESPEDIAAAFGCPPETVEKCLADLKKLEPAGIFSKDLSECLLRQLESQQETDPILIRIISDFLPDLLRGNLGKITRALGISTAHCRSCIRRIGELNPRPVMALGAGETEYVIPDILIRRENGAWLVSLNDSWMGEYRLNDYYLHMMQTTEDPELRAYFSSRLERARVIITSIERRRKTILRIVEAVLDYQGDFFLRGGSLLPMTMDQLAQKLGISTSTVSRAIHNKYIQYRRPLLLRDLFTSSASNHTDASPDLVREQIRELVRNEDRSHPLSDDRISKLLTKKGMGISRRTVAKYRMQMDIPDSRLRSFLK